MKKLIFFAGVLLFAVACTNKEKVEDNAVTTEASDNPYTLTKPYQNWQTGDQKNAILVLKMLKAWENKNIEESVSYFADTVDITLDMFHERMPKDSIKTFFQGSYEMYSTNLKITMNDWESVISEDKNDEWVTVWYKQSWVDAKGVADSMNCINDAKIENGKIVVFDEYIQHFPAAKK